MGRGSEKSKFSIDPFNGSILHSSMRNELVCPYCGFIHKPEDVDYKTGTGRTDCSNPDCEREFEFEGDPSIYYSTSKLEDDDAEGGQDAGRDRPDDRDGAGDHDDLDRGVETDQ